MKIRADEKGKCRKVREDVIEKYFADKIIDCPWKDVNVVLSDWDQVMERAEEISKEIGYKFFFDNPQCKKLFPTLANVYVEDMPQNEDFKKHSLAILRGIHSIIQNLSGKYEEENEILPVISETHARRGVNCKMLFALEQALISAIFHALDLPLKKKSSWETNLGKSQTYGELEEIHLLCGITITMQKTKTENHFKKLFHVRKPTRRSSLAEVRETHAALKNSPAGVKSQITSPIALIRKQSIGATTASPTPSDRRPSRALLHPDHAKLMVKRSSLLTPPSQRFSLSFEDSPIRNGLQPSPLSSSAASSITSISNAPALESQHSDPLQNYESRKSSTTTNKYSILDAHDLEYSLIKAAAARGSIGPCSLSQSLQRLTFTQSLAFPELARGVSNKRKASQNNTRNKLNPLDSGVNAFAKVATALLLVLISVLVFGVLYKFIRT